MVDSKDTVEKKTAYFLVIFWGFFPLGRVGELNFKCDVVKITSRLGKDWFNCVQSVQKRLDMKNDSSTFNFGDYSSDVVFLDVWA